VAGTWKDLTGQRKSPGEKPDRPVVRKHRRGDDRRRQRRPLRKVSVDAKGEVQELKNTINTMVDQLPLLRRRGDRVAKEVRTDGKLGGAGRREGRVRTWRT